MKKKKLKVIGIILGCAVVLLTGIAIYSYYNFPISVYAPKAYKYAGNVQLDKEMTVSEVKADVEKMIDIMEGTHPIFLEKQSKEYKEA